MLLKIEMQTRWNDTDSKSKKEALKYILKIHNERKSCDIKREENAATKMSNAVTVKSLGVWPVRRHAPGLCIGQVGREIP